MKVSQPAPVLQNGRKPVNGNDYSMSKERDPEVVPKAKRRRFSA